MYLLVTTDFQDSEHDNITRKAGEVLNVDVKRAKQILKAGYAKKATVHNLQSKKTAKEKSTETKGVVDE